jgi:hypothetical protein
MPEDRAIYGADAPSQADASQADAAFLRTAAQRDTASLDRLLDPDFTWTDANGHTLARNEVLSSPPRPAEQDGAEIATRVYGRVAVVTSRRDGFYTMRIHVKHEGGWRVLVYHEVAYRPSPGAAAHASPAEFDTSNPCHTIPYTPRNDDERALIESWQLLERAVVAGKGDDWASHVADEFIVVGNQRIQTKAERRAAVNKGGAAPPPLVSARMFQFGDTIVMTCRHQPHGGRKPTRVSRVFIKGEPWWQMAISYQTTIAAPT